MARSVNVKSTLTVNDEPAQFVIQFPYGKPARVDVQFDRRVFDGTNMVQSSVSPEGHTSRVINPDNKEEVTLSSGKKVSLVDTLAALAMFADKWGSDDEKERERIATEALAAADRIRTQAEAELNRVKK